MLVNLTLKDFEERFVDRHLVHGAVEKWARERPESIALIDSNRGSKVDWATFDRASTQVALKLLQLGFRKGDCVATILPLTTEHLFLEYGCFKLGVIFVPLDMRLGPSELKQNLERVAAIGVAFTRCPAVPDPTTFLKSLGPIPLKVAIQVAQPSECAEGVTPISNFLAEGQHLDQEPRRDLKEAYSVARASVHPEDGALVIFTTGSTGSPKPALLSHRNISCQAMCISRLLRGDKPLVTLVNLPPSHVGGQTELLMGTLFEGGTAVLVPVFDPVQSLHAIATYGITAIGQIPAMFQFEWRLKEYESFDISSLELVAYGGQQVSAEFVSRVAAMAPFTGTGLGLTETAGFCTYIRRDRENAAECASTLGTSMPVYPVSIREPMKEDGSAGDELPPGQAGHVCFHGPQTFLGYLNDPEATASAISQDGYLYTGDIGYLDERGLHLAGRHKLIIKPAGYQVFPGDVEMHLQGLPQVASCAVVGVEHPVISEAIVAFVECKPETELTIQLLEKHARTLATYMRPRHYVILKSGEMPLNRVAKADYLQLKARARREVEELRIQGLWR